MVVLILFKHLLLFDKLRRRNKSNIVSIKMIKTVKSLTLKCIKQFKIAKNLKV